MTIRALEGFVPTWYTPAGQDGIVTRFKLKPLDGEEYGDVAEHFSFEDGMLKLSNQGMKNALAHGLVGWENFTTEAGAIDFSQAYFKTIPYYVRQDLAREIVLRSDLSPGEKKT